MSKKSVANVFSEAFSPFILAGILLIAVAVSTDPTWLAPVVFQLIFIIGVPLALSLWLHRAGKTTDRFVRVRKQRTPIYLTSLGSWGFGALLVNFTDTSTEVKTLVNLLIATLFLVTAINLKIKISIHGLTAALFAVLLPLYLPLSALIYVFTGAIWACTVWARFILNRHSILELVLGTGVGTSLAITFLALT